jgi:type I restriction enzyme, S subunit
MEPGVLKVSAVRPGFYDAWEAKPLPDSAEMPAKAKVEVGDVLITRANTRPLVGAVCRVHDASEPRYCSRPASRAAWRHPAAAAARSASLPSSTARCRRLIVLCASSSS